MDVRSTIALVVLLAMCAYLVATSDERTEQAIVARMGQLERVRSPYFDEFRSALSMATRDTRLEDRWMVDRPPSSGGLSAYLVDSSQPGARRFFTMYPTLANNCAASPTGRLIVCDVKLFQQIEARVMRSTHPSQAAAIRRAIVLWIVSHEVGHVLLGHSGAHFFSDLPADPSVATTKIQNLETAADDFAADRLAHAPDEVGPAMLISLINSEVVSKVGVPEQYGVGILYDYGTKLDYSTGCSHPEYIIRATRMLHRYADERKSAGMKYMLRSYSAQLAERDQTCPPTELH